MSAVPNIQDKRKFHFGEFAAKQRAVVLLIVIVFFCLLFSLIYPQTFGTFENFALILLNMSAEALPLIAITLILISGEIDLSIGSLMVLGGMLCGRFMILSGWPMVPAILVSLVICMACGFLNGIVVSKLNVTSFIATLGTGMIFLGVAILLAGVGWTDFPDRVFQAMGQAKVLGLQLPVFYMIIFIVIFAVLFSRTRYFRQYYYIGGNQKAAMLSGINITKSKVVAFTLSAGLACLAGIISAMRFNSALNNIGSGVELRAITAAVIGGVSFTGGTGSMPGAAMGALFVACLNNALATAKVSPDLQSVVTGVVLILAIVIDIIIAKRKAK